MDHHFFEENAGKKMWITSGKNVDRQKLKKHRVFEGDPQKSCIFSRKMQKKMWITSGKNVDRQKIEKTSSF